MAEQELMRISFDMEEASFLREYSESGDRSRALAAAGLLPTNVQDYAAAQERATEIVTKADSLPLGMLAQAVGCDKVFFLGLLRRMCLDSTKPMLQAKAMALLAQVHGVSKQPASIKRQLALVFSTPGHLSGQGQDAGLPFAIPAEYAHLLPTEGKGVDS